MVREAIESLDVADTLHMSGARATFTQKRGTKVSQAQVTAALEKRNMKLEHFGAETRPRAEELTVATVTGLG